MRKIVNATSMTLDGDITHVTDWHLPYFREEAREAATVQLFASDALIMGRRTYQVFAGTWPQRAGTDAFADRMNSIDKYVVSRTLHAPEWENTRVISGDVAAEVRRLRAADGRNILQYGFGPVTRLLLENGLLDELRLWLHPVLSGRAAPEECLRSDALPASFTLNGTETHRTGVVILSYTPEPALVRG